MADLGTTTYTSVTWTAGDIITEAKLDNMVANDQAYDSHAAQGLLLNNEKAYCGKDSGGTARNMLKMDSSDIVQLGDSAGMTGFGTPIAYGLLKSKMVTFNRDCATASGDVAITGVGFTPSAIIFIGAITNSTVWSNGFTDENGAEYSIQGIFNGNVQVSSVFCIRIYPAASAYQEAVLKTFDADGFTLTWTKNNSPTGIGTIYALCLK